MLFTLIFFCSFLDQVTSQTNLGRITSYSISGDQGSGYIGDLVVSEESVALNVIAVINAMGTTVSTTDVESGPQVKVYPNPTTSTIRIESEAEINFYEIYNSIGRLVYRGSERSIDLTSLPIGSYHLSLNGKVAVTFIKQ